MDFMKLWYPNKTAKIFCPDPTWPTHKGIAGRAGFETAAYRYYDRKNKNFDKQGMLEDLDKAEDEQIVIMHACAHNPTGCDPSQEDWGDIFEVVKRKKHFVSFDNAYQGFASGDLVKDSYAVRHFAEHYDRVAHTQSFAKNFGLYGERAGCVSFVCHDPGEVARLSSRVKQIARPMYSSPPIHGARIVDVVLGDAELTKSWHESLAIMSGRLATMRTEL